MTAFTVSCGLNFPVKLVVSSKRELMFVVMITAPIVTYLYRHLEWMSRDMAKRMPKIDEEVDWFEKFDGFFMMFSWLVGKIKIFYGLATKISWIMGIKDLCWDRKRVKKGKTNKQQVTKVTQLKSCTFSEIAADFGE